jgi:hypothetical protein
VTEGELEHGLTRWTLSVAGEKDSVTLKRFRPLGYGGIKAAGGIECVEGGSVFFCHVTPGATVEFGRDEKIVARTGFFGSILHQGGFELTKLDSTQ